MIVEHQFWRLVTASLTAFSIRQRTVVCHLHTNWETHRETRGNVHETSWTHSSHSSQSTLAADQLPHWVQGSDTLLIRTTGSPAYLLPAVSNYIPTRHVRSSYQLLLSKPAVRTTETARCVRSTRLLPLSGIVCRSKITFSRLQDNFTQPFVLITVDLLLIIDHVTVSARTIRPKYVDLRSVIKD